MVKKQLTRPAPGWVASGRRIYAIGDVHGCAGRLAGLHRMIGADVSATPVSEPLIIHIGDYIDRGPDSATVVGMLATEPVLLGIPVVNLRGNHEQMMLDALTGDPDSIRHWRDNNAQATLRSWGTSLDRPVAEWRTALTPQDWAFLTNLPLYHQVDGYVFVHAGVRPGVTLSRQSDEDLLWIREEFLDWTGPYLLDQPSLAVVHGHTPEPRPIVTRRRIGIDTGAVKGGALTCAVLEGNTVRFLDG